MDNFSTLFFLVNNNEGLVEDAGTTDQLVKAPERAVQNIIAFARSYKVLPSKSLEYIDLYEN